MKKRNDAIVVGVDVQKDYIVIDDKVIENKTIFKKPYPLTKKIGLAVLVVTEGMVLALFGWAVYAEKIQQAFDAAGYQMIIFAAFWGVKAVADNIKSVRGKE